MLKQSVEDVARQLLGGCEAARGREVFVHGPQAVEVYRLAKQHDPKLPLDEEIERIAAGGQLVAAQADNVAEVCRVVLAAADAAPADAVAPPKQKAATGGRGKKKADAAPAEEAPPSEDAEKTAETE